MFNNNPLSLLRRPPDLLFRVFRWCGPCKILGPRLEKAVAKQNGKVTMAKVDIDDHTDLAIEYGVSAVPTVIAIRGGDVIDHFVGIKDDDELESFVSKIIGK
ncbi:thioredoxin, mitochondrial-like [Notothenia coriiceps]|uniref:Thioredoxin, mitochondrial-like n=1 Tax=Notothenia coriiceps TaxID=8208 RepID=A0A6I9MXE6_9TELE|nr:PREDICTED: thioredoxin, mitochondrial-like [Notothenia coriiceps]